MIEILKSFYKRKFVKSYWKRKVANKWHKNRRDTHDSDTEKFVSHISPIIEKLEYNTIIDFGTGSGRLAYYLSERFNDKKCIGIDINKRTIKDNKKYYKENNLLFESDLLHCIKKYNLKNVILVERNVISYLKQREIEFILRMLYNNLVSATVILSAGNYSGDKSNKRQKEVGLITQYDHNIKKIMLDEKAKKVDKIQIGESYSYIGYFNK